MREVPLSNGGVALVDDADFAAVSAHTWLRSTHRGKVYASRRWQANGRRHYEYLHHFIAGKHTGHETDHRNGNGLDNTRLNLRIATRSQNAANSPSTGGVSQYKGVCWHKQRGRWTAYIKKNMKRHYLGLFDTEQAAALAYDAAAIEFHGEFAYLNFQADRHMASKHPDVVPLRKIAKVRA